MRLNEVMSTDVERIAASDTPGHAQTLMRGRGIRHLVVFDGRSVIGIVTADDLRSARATGAETVRELVTRRVVTAPPTCTVRQAANLLRGASLSALPVIERGKLVGIVTVSDLLELLGRGAERPVAKTRRWVMRDRGVRPRRPQVGLHR